VVGTYFGDGWWYTFQNVGRGTFVGAPVTVANGENGLVSFLEESEHAARWFMRRPMADSSVQ
jgi:hypothetical protein